MQIFSTLASLCRRERSWRSVLKRARSLWVLLGILLVSSGGLLHAELWAQAEVPLQVTDLYRMQEVREVTLSPSGRFAAYVVRRIEPSGTAPEGPAVHHTQLLVAPATGGDAPRVLTRPDADARQPNWHPDGSHLAFVRPVQGTPQVFILPLRGGEPYQLTSTPYGARHPSWSPDGERILYVSTVPQSTVRRQTGRPAPSERPGRTSRALFHMPPPDTILVLRDAQSLDPIDTLDLGPNETARLRSDTARALHVPRSTPTRDSLALRLTGRIDELSPDSLRTVLDSLHLRPDTTTVAVQPDTAASPDGTLLQMRRWLNQNRGNATALVSSHLDFQGEHKLTPTPTYRHHYLVEVPAGIDTGTPPRPTPRPVTQGYRSYGQAEWLPGSSQIIVSAPPSTPRHPDRVRQHNLYVVDLNRDRIQRLLRIDNHTLTSPSVTSDGTLIAFRMQSLIDTSDAQADVGLFSLDGRSEPRIITSTLDRDVGPLRWSPDGWYLYTTAPSRGGVPLYRFSPFSPDTTASPSMPVEQATSRDTFALDSTMMRPAPFRQMTSERRTVHDFDATAATAVYAATGPRTPSALFTNTVSFGNERRLSTHNAEWLSGRQLSPPRSLTATSDSLTVHGWVTQPVPFVDSLQYPLLVLVRGGPSELNVPHTPEAWFERQYLASQGIGIVEVLPRGSVGYGTSFRRANDQNWGPGPAQDVLALADSAVALPWTDGSQQTLAGASYGATLTTWLLGQTDRFDAAIALNGVYDLPAFVDGGRGGRIVPREFGGYPWDGAPAPPTGPPLFSAGFLPSVEQSQTPWTALHRNSPITYANQIHTPLLVLQGGSNRRVGLSQGERLYKRLKILNRAAEYVEYPGVGHDVADTATPTQRLDRLVRLYEFLARYIDPGGQPPSQGSQAAEAE